MNEETRKKLEALAKQRTAEEQEAVSRLREAQATKDRVERQFMELREKLIAPTLQALAADLSQMEGNTATVENDPAARDQPPSVQTAVILKLSRASGPASELRVAHDGHGNVRFTKVLKTASSTSTDIVQTLDFNRVTPGTIEGVVVEFVDAVFKELGSAG